MNSSAHSQPGFPHRTLYNGVPAVMISEQQENYLNHLYIRIQGYQQQNDSLISVIDSCIQGFHDADSIISIQHSIILADNVFISHQQASMDTLQYVITDQKKTIKRLKVHRTLSTIGEGVLGIVVMWLLLR